MAEELQKVPDLEHHCENSAIAIDDVIDAWIAERGLEFLQRGNASIPDEEEAGSARAPSQQEASPPRVPMLASSLSSMGQSSPSDMGIWAEEEEEWSFDVTFGTECQGPLGMEVEWGFKYGPQVATVSLKSAAHEKGILPGDEFVSINSVRCWAADTSVLVGMCQMRPLVLRIRRPDNPPQWPIRNDQATRELHQATLHSDRLALPTPHGDALAQYRKLLDDTPERFMGLTEPSKAARLATDSAGVADLKPRSMVDDDPTQCKVPSPGGFFDGCVGGAVVCQPLACGKENSPTKQRTAGPSAGTPRSSRPSTRGQTMEVPIPSCRSAGLRTSRSFTLWGAETFRSEDSGSPRRHRAVPLALRMQKQMMRARQW